MSPLQFRFLNVCRGALIAAVMLSWVSLSGPCTLAFMFALWALVSLVGSWPLGLPPQASNTHYLMPQQVWATPLPSGSWACRLLLVPRFRANVALSNAELRLLAHRSPTTLLMPGSRPAWGWAIRGIYGGWLALLVFSCVSYGVELGDGSTLEGADMLVGEGVTGQLSLLTLASFWVGLACVTFTGNVRFTATQLTGYDGLGIYRVAGAFYAHEVNGTHCTLRFAERTVSLWKPPLMSQHRWQQSWQAILAARRELSVPEAAPPGNEPSNIPNMRA